MKEFVIVLDIVTGVIAFATTVAGLVCNNIALVRISVPVLILCLLNLGVFVSNDDL